MQKTSVILLCIGKKGSGKTYFIKQYLNDYFARLPRLINDVNNEYGVGEPPSGEIFIKKSLQFTDGVIVYEEATSLFGYQRDDATASVITRSRHKGTCLIFSFHSFADVPRYIARNADFLVIFKTGDVHEDVAKKFGRNNKPVLNAFADIYFAEMLIGESGFKYSPKKIIKL